MTDTCKTCRYWESTQAMYGNCLRRAPFTKDRGPNIGPRYITAWTETRSGDWCGEHQPQEKPNADT